MPTSPPTQPKPRSVKGRPPFERVARLLQGGGALGAYHGGVYWRAGGRETGPNRKCGFNPPHGGGNTWNCS
jgi:NTE family protein